MINIHGATLSNVVANLPLKAARITATSQPVNTALVQQWIESASGQINALLARHNMETLGEDEQHLVRAGIEAFAGAMALGKFGADSDTRKPFWDIWNGCRKTVRETPQDLGNSMLPEDAIITNIDLEDPTRTSWTSKTFGGW